MWRLLLMIFGFCLPVTYANNSASEIISNVADDVRSFGDKILEFERRLQNLALHQQTQDFYTAERIRSDGQSGIKLIRSYVSGTRPYHIQSHTGPRMAGMHDHANFQRVVGLGEMLAVINGAEFRTRHNDYHLVHPHRYKKELFATQPINFPSIPGTTRLKTNVEDQIKDMREWFKTWRDQKVGHRNHNLFFKPILCYLEGAWFYPDQISVDLFHSDRHKVEATDFLHLQKQTKYTSDSGRKDDFENYSFLPRTVFRMANGTEQYAQWNHRILCHPISRDLPLNRFRVVDDIGVRMAQKRSFAEHALSLSARFQLNPHDKDEFKREGAVNHGLLDELMEEVPGLDNYKGNITDDAFGVTAYEMKQNNQNESKLLNAAYYHRWFMTKKRGAFGLGLRHRGFSDDGLFVALNTQPAVVPTEYEECTGKNAKKVCHWKSQRFSYAIPLEIIYLTPLSRWNPYDIVYKGDSGDAEWRTVRADGRNGGKTIDKAFNGSNHITYFMTPAEFFEGGELAADPVDTSSNSAVGVLNNSNHLNFVRDSGVRMFFPVIPEVGLLRQRYPIMPIHGEGSSVWKELEALKDMVLDSNAYSHMFRQNLPGAQDVETEAVDYSNRDVVLKLSEGKTDHFHLIRLSADDISYLQTGASMDTATETAADHVHTLTLKYRGNSFLYSNLLPFELHGSELLEDANPTSDANVL